MNQGQYQTTSKSPFSKTSNPITTTFKSNLSQSPSPTSLPKSQNYLAPSQAPSIPSQSVSKRLTYNPPSNQSASRPLPSSIPPPSINSNQYKHEYQSILKQSQLRIANALASNDILNKQNIINKQSYIDRYSYSYNNNNNSAYDGRGSRVVNYRQQIQNLQNEHRVQVEKLLIQISRLHDVIYEIQRNKKWEIQKLKEQCQKTVYMQMNCLKNSQISQLEILETQIYKLNQNLQQKSIQIDKLEKTIQKQRQMFKNQIQILRNSLKQVVNKKNDQLFEIQQGYEQKIKNIQRMNVNEIDNIREQCNKQLKKFEKDLLTNKDQLHKLQQTHNDNLANHTILEQTHEQQRQDLEYKLEQHTRQSIDKYNRLTQHIQLLLEQQETIQEQKENILKNIYEGQIDHLKKIINVKVEEGERVRIGREKQKQSDDLWNAELEKENKQLKDLIKKLQKQNLRDIQLLKVKMALLHENDIKQLIKLYDRKIEALNSELEKQENQTTRLRDYMHEETGRWYQNKKNYQLQISKLKVEILRLKGNLGNIQNDAKERLENERSAMLLTSKSLIRGAELKNANAQFFEEQARKLRMTVDKLEKQCSNVQRQLKEQIRNLQQQIKRLTQIERKNQNQWHSIEDDYRKIISQKQNQIKRLNQITRDLIANNKIDESADLQASKQMISQFKKQLLQKSSQIKQLCQKIDALSIKIGELRTQNQQLYLQNQINHDQAKKQYEALAMKNTQIYKDFYERKIQQLESDKEELKRKIQIDGESITELVRRYQLMQDYVRKMVKLGKKRTELQQRIVQLGMDQNLVKNKAELFGEYSQINREGREGSPSRIRVSDQK